MPELPEVEITARLIGAAIGGAQIESAVAPGINALKTFDPPLSALEGRRFAGARRRGKLFLLDVVGHDAGDGSDRGSGGDGGSLRSGGDGELTLMIHLMSAGRLQLFDTRATLRDRTSRLLVRLTDGRELRLREFGTRQRAWVKLLRAGEVESEETVAELGPEAWPEPPPLRDLLDQRRPLYAVLRDQHVIAGIGRSWVDEILHRARLSPFKRGVDLDDAELDALRGAIVECLGSAIAEYEAALALPIPDKLPMPLTVHRRNGQPCPRCGQLLEAVFYEDYVMCYCPHCQTDDKVLKDRRLSRLLK